MLDRWYSALIGGNVLRLGEVRAMTVTSAGLYIRLALYFAPYFAKPFVRRLLRVS